MLGRRASLELQVQSYNEGMLKNLLLAAAWVCEKVYWFARTGWRAQDWSRGWCNETG